MLPYVACLAGLLLAGTVRADYPKSATTVVVSTTTTVVVQSWPSPTPNIVNVCTTTHTQWESWQAAPTPALDFKLSCEDSWSLGHELAYIPDSALANQALDVKHYHFAGPADSGKNSLYFCCDTCLSTEGCALYQFSPEDGGVCKHFVVTKGSGTKTLGYCKAGMFEVEAAPPKAHRPRSETGEGMDGLYGGGIMPGPCYSAGRVSSWECSDGTWA